MLDKKVRGLIIKLCLTVNGLIFAKYHVIMCLYLPDTASVCSVLLL